MSISAHDEDLRASIDALEEALFRMSALRDTTGRIVDFRYELCNAAALKVLGRTQDEVIGRHLLELFPSHVDNGLFDAYVRVVETGEPLRFEFPFEEAGVVGEFEVTVSRVGDGYVLAGHDISERKRMERQLELVKEQLETALTTRIVIEQAKGYMAALTRTDPETAFLALRGYARNNNRRISDVARAVVSGAIDPDSAIESTA